MFDRISRSWTLVKASASVLRDEKDLLLFPLISFASLLVVLVSFAIPAWQLGVLEALSRHGHASAGGYLVAFLFYFVQYFVIFFFNAGLVGAAMMRLDGGEPTFADGMRIATARIGVIAGYAAIAAYPTITHTLEAAMRIPSLKVGWPPSRRIIAAPTRAALKKTIRKYCTK